MDCIKYKTNKESCVLYEEIKAQQKYVTLVGNMLIIGNLIIIYFLWLEIFE